MFGGAIYSLADVTAGMVAALDLRDYVTQNSSFSFTHNISCGTAYAVGEILHRNGRIAAVNVKVYSKGQELLAFGTFHMFAVNTGSIEY